MSQAPEVKARTEVRDVMRITWHEAIPMDDGGEEPVLGPAAGTGGASVVYAPNVG